MSRKKPKNILLVSYLKQGGHCSEVHRLSSSACSALSPSPPGPSSSADRRAGHKVRLSVFSGRSSIKGNIRGKVKVQPYRVALLLLGDILVDVLVSPVEHEFLFLSLIHPHDGSGDLLNDALKLAQLSHTIVGHFLRENRSHCRYMSDNSEHVTLLMFMNFVVKRSGSTCRLSHSFSRMERLYLSPIEV